MLTWFPAASGVARRTSPGDVFWLSALAKLGATVVTYPLLLVKARLMSSGKHTSEERRYTGTLDALERIWKTEGGRPLSNTIIVSLDSRA